MKKVLLIATCLLLVTAVANAQSFSRSTSAPVKPPVLNYNPNPASITHSSDTSTITQFNSVSCNAGGLHTDNSYLRNFQLSTFDLEKGYNISSVDIAIEEATGAGGSQPLDVNLYSRDKPCADNTPFLFTDLTPVGSTSTTINDGPMQLINVPVSGKVGGDACLVVEIFTPDGQGAGNSLFIGSNPNGETDCSYLAALDCGVPDPLCTGSLGFPTMHVVMVVNGDEQPVELQSFEIE